MVKKLANWILWIVLLNVALIYTLGGGFGRSAGKGVLPDVLAFAHRGVRPSVENSSAAIQLAMSIPDCKAIELDVRQSKDGQPLLVHDPNTERLTGSSLMVDECTADELLALHFRSSEDGIISLDSALGLIGPSLYVYLDLKEANRSMVDHCIQLLTKHNLLDRVLIASSRYQILAYAKFMEPRTQTVLEGFTQGKVWLHRIFPRKWQPDYFALFIGDANPQHIQALREAKLLSSCIVYGVSEGDILPSGVLKMISDMNHQGQSMP